MPLLLVVSGLVALLDMAVRVLLLLSVLSSNSKVDGQSPVMPIPQLRRSNGSVAEAVAGYPFHNGCNNGLHIAKHVPMRKAMDFQLHISEGDLP